MANSLTAKVQKVSLAHQADEDEAESVDLPAAITRRVIGLHHLQDQCDELQVEYKKERLALELKYRELKQPLYDQRYEVISGAVEPQLTPEEEADITAQVASTEEVMYLLGNRIRVVRYIL